MSIIIFCIYHYYFSECLAILKITPEMTYCSPINSKFGNTDTYRMEKSYLKHKKKVYFKIKRQKKALLFQRRQIIITSGKGINRGWDWKFRQYLEEKEAFSTSVEINFHPQVNRKPLKNFKQSSNIISIAIQLKQWLW